MPNDVLRVADLRAAIALALDAVESELGTEIRVDRDHYWHLPVGDAFDLAREPTDLTVGQVSDDLVEVAQSLSSGYARPAWHGLSHVIGLMRLVEDAALRGS